MHCAKELQKLLTEINSLRSEDFIGLGLLIYDKNPELLPISPLKKNYINIQLPIISRNNIVDFLTKVSSANNPNHDGFHLLNKHFELTHISQFIAPPIIKGIDLEFKYGSRYRTALYSSYIENVLATGVLSNNYQPTVFVKGSKY